MAVLTRARSWLYDVFVHNHAEQLRLQRAVQRKKLGVEQAEYPYPGAVSNSGNPVAIYHTGGGLVKGAMLAAALLVGGAGGMYGISLLNHRPAPAERPAKEQPPPTTRGLPDSEWDAIYEQQDPRTGEWKQIDRKRLPKESR